MAAAQGFVLMAGVVVLFQIGVLAGLPWRGFDRGVPAGRLGAAAMIAVMLGAAWLLVAAVWGGLGWPGWGAVAMIFLWFIKVALSPSEAERVLWRPFAGVMVAAGLVAMLAR